MRPPATNRLLVIAQARARRGLQSMFRDMANTISAMLSRVADGDGKIPTNQNLTVREQARIIVGRYFTQESNGIARAYADDEVTPLAPYGAFLNERYALTVGSVVMAHAVWMKANTPDDVFQYLATTRPRSISETERVFRPNLEIDPNRQWVPMHRWTDVNGYRLSDRIWRTDQATRQKIDALLAKGLAQGTSALNLSKALEAYLIPTRTGIRTLKPYGKQFMPDGASYDALRLARTELSRAFNSAAVTSAYLNPYTSGMDWRLSASHPKTDVCDTLATIGMAGERLRDPYPFESMQSAPAHPQCICTMSPAMTDSPETVVERLRKDMLSGAVPFVNPAQPQNLLRDLLGSALLGYVLSEFDLLIF